MITDRDFSEYRNLCTTLGNLREKFIKRRREVGLLLQKTASNRREALLVLAKANRLTRHLTGRQRQTAGISYRLGDIKMRINQAALPAFKGSLDEAEPLSEIQARIPTGMPAGIRELKSMGLAVIEMINRLKKTLLQLDLLEKRCRELILSINKALEVFRHEFKIIYRKIYPFGFFSFVHRSLRRLFGNNYFTFRDMDEVSALGYFTGLVLKIADSPLI